MLVDHSVVSRLERSLADYEASVVDAYRAAGDEIAVADRFGDGVLIAQGPGRYVNRAIGVSLADPGDDGLDHIEAFFRGAGLESAVELSSWAHPSVPLRLGDRGYRPAWFGDMFVRTADGEPAATTTVTVRTVGSHSLVEWQRIFAAAFGYDSSAAIAATGLHTTAVFNLPGTLHYLADIDGRPAGCGSLYVADGVAWLGGAATMQGCRGNGVQSALLAHRLVAASNAGAELVAATAVPSGVSARNLRRSGFVLAQTRLVMRRRDDLGQLSSWGP